MIYLICIGIFIYWAIGVYILVEYITEDSDLRLGFFVLIILLFWFFWPSIVLRNIEYPIIVKKKNNKT